MAGTHKQMGLFKPPHRTSEVSTVDGKDLELLPIDPPHPAGNIRRLPIPGSGIGIAIRSQASLILRKFCQIAEIDPGVVRSPAKKAGKHITDNGNGDQCRGDGIEPNAEHEQKAAA